jgi:hypothetical protein
MPEKHRIYLEGSDNYEEEYYKPNHHCTICGFALTSAEEQAQGEAFEKICQNCEKKK